MADVIKKVERWHEAARPVPTKEDMSVQLGCHLEEIAEMLRALTFHSDAHVSRRVNAAKLVNMVDAVAQDLKQGLIVARISDRLAMLDGLCDQVVTGVGVAYCTGMDIHSGVEEVNRSNWSKFVAGKPLFDENGKVKKGDAYTPPDLGAFV